MSTTTTTEKDNYVSAHEQAEQLSEEFVEVESATQTDGTILATVTSIEKTTQGLSDAKKIRVRTETPLGRRGTHIFDIPEPWTEEFEFVRWVRANGSAAGRLDNLIGEKVPLDDKSLVIPEKAEPLRTRIRERVSEHSDVFGAINMIWILVTWPVTAPYAAALYDEHSDPDDVAIAWVMGTIIWAFAALFTYEIVISPFL